MEYSTYEEYKSSKCDWLREVPKHWEVKRLKNVASYNDDSLDESTDPDYEMVYVDISSVSLIAGITNPEKITFEKAPSRARRIVKDGDILISTVRTYLKAITSISSPPENMIASTGFAVVRPMHSYNSNFLNYLVKSEGFVGSVVANSVGVSYPAINASELAKINVVEPPFEEQQKIADFLDYKTAQIDALIAKKEALLLKLQEKRSALITQAVTKGINLSVPMKNTGLNWAKQIPQGWKVKKVTHSISYRVGFTPESGNAAYYGEGYPWVNISDLGDRVINNPAKQITDDAIEKYKKSPAKKGSVLYSFKLSVGQVSFAGRDMYTNEAIAAFEESKDLLLSYFYYLAPIAIIQNASENIYGAKILNQEAIGNAKLIVPPKDEQQKIADFLDKITHEIDLQTKKVIEAIGKLEEYRSALITNAVTGKIDVRDFDIPSEN